MANFGKEQLMKYGWIKGKGLGKNENGITEPIKLAANQNKAGIGYDDGQPWWERVFNNATKNVKVESHGDEVSLTVVNNIDASHVSVNEHLDSGKTVRHNNFQRFIEAENVMLTQTAHVPDPKGVGGVHCNEMAHETTKHNLALGGKLERIAEQDRTFLNVNSLLSATSTRENTMAYRKTSVESDVEENEHKIDNNASIMHYASIEGKRNLVIISKSAKKKHRKNINKLVEQLSTCNLEENSQKQDFPNNRKLCQKMKKNKEEKTMSISNKVLNHLKHETRTELLNEFISTLNSTSKRISKKFDRIRQLQIKLKELDKIKIARPIDQTINTISDNVSLGRCENEKDNTECKAELNPELRIESINEVTDKQCKNWIIIDSGEKAGGDFDSMIPSRTDSVSERSISKLNAEHYLKCTSAIQDKYELIMRTILQIDIQKKKDLRSRSKQIQKITEKLKNAALTQELNTVIKTLTVLGLAEEVNANTIKNKPTQTHLTPV